MKNRDIIITGLQPFDLDIGSNCRNIAIEFSENNRVLYVNSPLDRITVYKNKSKPEVRKRLNMIKKKENGIVRIKENLWNYYPDTILESINKIKSKNLFDFLNRMNNKRFANSIKKAIDILEFRNYILFIDGDMFRSFYMKELLNPALSVYYSRDNFVAVDYWKLHGTRLEPELMRKSDLVTANSTYLAERGRKYNKNSFYVGQGCDTSEFNPNLINEKPSDISDILSPVIGYAGALYKLRLDIELLIYLAEKKPEWNLVLVGPEDSHFKDSGLHGMKNVFFTGPKDPAELPSYIKYFDVCINPQILNEVTIGNYPRKVDEYLAMGKPVVATKTEAMSVFAGHTFLAVTKEDYINFIQKALDETNTALESKRREFALTHTWANSVNEIYKGTLKFLK